MNYFFYLSLYIKLNINYCLRRKIQVTQRVLLPVTHDIWHEKVYGVREKKKKVPNGLTVHWSTKGSQNFVFRKEDHSCGNSFHPGNTHSILSKAIFGTETHHSIWPPSTFTQSSTMQLVFLCSTIKDSWNYSLRETRFESVFKIEEENGNRDN